MHVVGPAGWVRSWPSWVRAILGLTAAVVGLVIVLRPFTSLSVLILVVAIGAILTGVATIGSSHDVGFGPIVEGVAWLALGVAVLALPDVSVRALAVIVGVAMIGSGLTGAWHGFRGTTDQRVAAVIGGMASAIFGVLALAWPDVTLLVVAVVFGARTILFGLRMLLDAVRLRDRATVTAEPTHALGSWRRWGHVASVCAALVVAVALAAVSSQLHRATNAVDEFYSAPADVPDEPGALLRVEPFDRGIPEDAEAWRILYTTTRDEGVPAVASGIVVVPADRGEEPLPVIAWAHGTTGVARPCAPSVMEASLAAGAFFLGEEVIERGWALVATDYVGLGTEGPHPYLIGQGQGRSVLDSIRAARQMPDLPLSDETVVWGHSQGGNAALWTGVLAPIYAPDANVTGVAALAPASDLIGLVTNLGSVPGGSIFATYVLSAYADAYDDVTIGAYQHPSARVTFDETARRCLDAQALVSALASTLTGMSGFSSLGTGALPDRLEKNAPPPLIEAPLLIAQGADDALVLPEVQTAYVDGLCAAGRQVDLRLVEGRDHVQLVEQDSPIVPDLLDWTEARFAGEPAASSCGM